VQRAQLTPQSRHFTLQLAGIQDDERAALGTAHVAMGAHPVQRQLRLVRALPAFDFDLTLLQQCLDLSRVDRLMYLHRIHPYEKMLQSPQGQ
jgi:hypothetical protein